MLSLAPIHRQLEIFTELLGLFFFSPQYGQNKVYGQNNGIQIYSEKWEIFSYDFLKKTEPGQTATMEDFSQISLKFGKSQK